MTEPVNDKMRGYHHRDLRRAVMAGAVELIAEQGPAALSMRELARRAGVSHAAPAHHFTDKRGLFTAIAVEGNELLAAALQRARDEHPDDLVELGVAYVTFAAEHPAHLELMYDDALLHRDDPALAESRARTRALLRGGVGEGASTAAAGLAAWSLVHGFATLWRTGALAEAAAGRPAGTVFREVAATLRPTP